MRQSQRRRTVAFLACIGVLAVGEAAYAQANNCDANRVACVQAENSLSQMSAENQNANMNGTDQTPRFVKCDQARRAAGHTLAQMFTADWQALLAKNKGKGMTAAQAKWQVMQGDNGYYFNAFVKITDEYETCMRRPLNVLPNVPDTTH